MTNDKAAVPWQTLRRRLAEEARRRGLSYADLAAEWGLPARQNASRLLSPTGPEPRYSFGKRLELWLESRR
jgi:hypothetical protein